MPATRSVGTAVGAVLCVLLSPGSPLLHAQAVRGYLIDADTNRGIDLGSVALLDLSRIPVVVRQTQEDGSFLLRAPAPGEYYLYGLAMGYQKTLSGPLLLEAGDERVMEFRVDPDPLYVDPIEVAAERQVGRLGMVGFYQRQAFGWGLFLDEVAIEESNAIRASELFRRQRGIRVVPVRTETGLVRNRVSFRRGCVPALYVDGLLLRRAGGGEFLDDLLLATEVAGVEAFRSPAEVPLEYGGTGATCGVMLIWTK